MHADLAMNCAARCSTRRSDASTPPRRRLSLRLARFTLALAALLVMFYGQRFVIEHSARDVDELTVAACIADAIYGGSGHASACTSIPSVDQKESTL
jgi:hypothetical protein